MAAPDAFVLDDEDGHATAVFDGDVPADQVEPVREASRSCPEQAVMIDRDPAAVEGAAS